MEENNQNNQNNVNAENIKKEAKETVNQVKDSFKNIDMKQETEKADTSEKLLLYWNRSFFRMYEA